MKRDLGVCSIWIGTGLPSLPRKLQGNRRRPRLLDVHKHVIGRNLVRIAMLLLFGSMFGTILALSGPNDLNSVLGAPVYLAEHLLSPPQPMPIFADEQADNN